VNPRALHDLRIRQALAHTIDKQAINQGLFEGEGIMSDTIVPPTEDYYGTVDRALVKYGYDLRVAEQLLADAGFVRGVDGTYASPTEGRLNLELRVISSPQNDAERSIIADAWRRFGFEVEEGGFTAAQARDGETLTRFRALSTTSGPLGANSMVNYTTGQIPRAENRWVGQNRGGWSNPEYDRIFEQYQTTFMREERIGHLAQAARILSEQLGVIPLYFNPGVLAYPATLRGVSVKAAEEEATWSMYEWELRQG